MVKQEYVQKVEKLIAEYNTKVAVKTTTADELAKVVAALEDVEKNTRKSILAETYNAKTKEQDPMVALLTEYAVDVPSHKVNKESGQMEYQTRTATLDPVTFQREYIKTPAAWIHAIDKENVLMILKVARDLGREDFMDAIRDSKVVKEVYETESKNASKNKAGGYKLPSDLTSNAQISKRLQAIFDNMLGDGKVKIVAKDIGFLMNCATAAGKGAGAVKVLTGKRFGNLLARVAYVQLNKLTYDLECKVK